MRDEFLFSAFRDKEKVKALVKGIRRLSEKLGRSIKIMEFCGGHTHAIMRFGIDRLLEGAVRFVHGPGCPVCVMPMRRIDLAIELARREDVILCSYGDLLRVPGSGRKSLLDVRAEGGDVRALYTCLDALKIAKENPNKKVVFFAIGFETTTPQTAVLLKKALGEGIGNLFVVSNHVITPAAIQHILNSPELRQIGRVEIDAFIGPGHVSVIIGTRPYEYFAEDFLKPVVISGFEPLDILRAVYMIMRQLTEGRAEVENAYTRFVTYEGNLKAQKLVADVFELRKEFEWRGLGTIPYSSLRLKRQWRGFDAEERFDVKLPEPKEHPGCICGQVIRGVAKPTDCKLFGKVCTPSNPLGSCMVSSEGACCAYYKYRRGLEEAHSLKSL
ncbi:MAG: hydrogenase formation protein HypD [Aquificae bacterium]|nr:hydrogenase formation protein HypD [Aquificota bacterium]